MTDKPLKIGIACYPTYGGSGVLATELGVALAEKGHEIHFLAYEPPIRLTGFHSRVFYHQVGVPEYPLFRYPPYGLALTTQIVEVAERHDLDLVHVHYAIPHAASAWMAREMLKPRRLRMVVTLHGTDITIVGTDPSYHRATRFALEQAEGVTAVSSWLEIETRRIFETSRGIDVIPNFVDLTRFDTRPCPEASALHGQDSEPLLIHVSNFRPVKRVLDLVRAVAILSSTTPVQVLMVGDGPDRATAESLARSLGVAERFRFLGSQEMVEKILPCADLFVLPSLYESFGLAALEAMACGVPVVASHAGGLPEVIVEGETGALAPPADPVALARVIQRLLADRPALKAMGKAARRLAEQKFSLERILPRYEAHYRRVMEI
ncbi:MAG: N-acetyl-alpha-D-glucosaminyl L-malate synthase BshA [Planctomycetes bacterium]|nr:N-acetyl-alpha-D-glucosaminyl L-malate synthase BshA [Planctomycetota bacterium]